MSIREQMTSLLAEADKAQSTQTPKEVANSMRAFVAAADTALNPYIQYLQTQLTQVENMMAALRKSGADVVKQMDAVERQHAPFVKVVRQVSRTDSAEGLSDAAADTVAEVSDIVADFSVPSQVASAASKLFSELESALKEAEHHKRVLAKGMDAAKKLDRMG